MIYTSTFRRIRERKTNYRKRAKLLIGKKDFVTVNVSDQNVSAQLIRPQILGDKVMASVHSNELLNYGWKGSRKNLPSCYLVGLLLGKKCIQKKITQAVLYIGKRHFTTKIAACLKGLSEAGLEMPFSENIIPSDERIKGTHIAEYAKKLKSNDELYKSRFSSNLGSGLEPEDYQTHFSEVKDRIVNEKNEKKSDNQSKSISKTRSHKKKGDSK
ncbi:MAG: 50S ribosomal protein L18 [Thaumarchaeota archaeon]|nr:MAG: 50S ribosomal protein L18 [Nitrososphaerota archaeon]TLX91887.1 MAG: 50S ribosomal protein L18 [Nitrososphaerota archaeon]